jgi:hypothetical protein
MLAAPSIFEKLATQKVFYFQEPLAGATKLLPHQNLKN